MNSIPIYLSSPHSCSYLEQQTAQSAFVSPQQTMNASIYHELLQKGFRRSGNMIYKPHCKNCQACLSLRVPVKQFAMTRSQKRTHKKNQQTNIIVKPAEFHPQHYQLYLKYQKSRHQEGNMAKSDEQEYLQFLRSDWDNTCFVEFLSNGHLFCVAIVDIFSTSLSAVYTFFDPDYQNLSPGVYAILWQIDYAKQHDKDYVYLGYWIESCQKMAYKTQYQPNEVYRNKQWRTSLTASD